MRRDDRTTVALLSNIVVAPGHRRQGLAGRLVRAAQQDLPRLKADATLTPDGAHLLGVLGPDAEATAKPTEGATKPLRRTP